ncbi:MAG TPA: hypothetical protein VGC78_03810 [Gaiellaceae bacterium]
MTSWERIERVASVIRHAPSGGFSQGGSIVVTDSGTRGDRGRGGDEHYSLNGRLSSRRRPLEELVRWERW